MLEKLDENLLVYLSQIIEAGKEKAVAQVNSILTLVYWQVGRRINNYILNNERAEYGKEVTASISEQLVQRYGKSFEHRNLRRMIQFADVFPDMEIVSPLATQLSWTHFIVLLSVKSDDARKYYAVKSVEESWGKRELQRQIERKAFERNEIAQLQLIEDADDVKMSFKDPYFFDFLGIDIITNFILWLEFVRSSEK